jgi:chromosome segregation ATPase
LDQIPEWLKWIGGGIMGVLGLLATSKIVEKFVDRIHSKRDKREALHDSNAQAHIGAQTHAFDQIIERLKTVEKRVDELQSQVAQEMAKAARFEEQNKMLTAENERQRASIHGLRNTIQAKELEVVKMQGEITAMQEKIAMLEGEIQRLSKLEAKTHDVT